MQLIVVVILIGLISNIVASYLANFYFYGFSIGFLLIIPLIILTFVSIYIIVYPEEKIKTIIYTNILVDKTKNRLHLSKFSPFAVQYASLFWEALSTDKSSYSQQILSRLHDFTYDKIEFDFAEYVLFNTLSGYEFFWASNKDEYFGYTTNPDRLGVENNIYSYDPTIFRFQKDDKEFIDLFSLKNLECKNLKPILKNNDIIEHFLGKTTLFYLYKPDRWVIVTPKGTQISTLQKKFSRETHFHHTYFKLVISIQKHGVNMGLPYGIFTKENNNYNKENFFTSDFEITFQAKFSRWLLFNWRRDKYYNWVRLIRRKLVANFALDEKEFIKEI